MSATLVDSRCLKSTISAETRGTSLLAPGHRSRFGNLYQCPVCDYDLRGLPAEHRCPECGFRYDHQTRVWESGNYPSAPLALSEIVYLMLLLLWAARTLLSTSLLTPSYVLVVFVLGFWGIYLIYEAWRRRGHRFVAVTPEGVVYHLSTSRTGCIPWSQIGFVRTREVAGRPFVRFRNEATDGTLDLGPFLTDADAVRRFESAIQAGRAREGATRRPKSRIGEPPCSLDAAR